MQEVVLGRMSTIVPAPPQP